jgi:hypothetical protein
VLEFIVATGSFRPELQIFSTIALSLAALRWGAGPERASMFAFLLFWILEPFLELVVGTGTQRGTVDPGGATMDGIVAVVFIGIALYANRSYPLWLAAFQLISALSHLMRWIDPGMNSLAYAIMAIAPSWALLITIGIGIWRHHNRVKRFGPYKSWRISSRLLQAIDPRGYPSA